MALETLPKIIPSTRTFTSKAHHHEKFCIACHCGSSLRRSDRHCQHLGVQPLDFRGRVVQRRANRSGNGYRIPKKHCILKQSRSRFACLSVGLDKNSLSGTLHEVLLQAGTRIYHTCRAWASRHPRVCFARYLELHTLNAFVPLLQGGGRAPSSARRMIEKNFHRI